MNQDKPQMFKDNTNTAAIPIKPSTSSTRDILHKNHSKT